MLALMNAKNVLIISSQSFFLILEITSSSQSTSIISSSSSTRDKRAIKDSLLLSNNLLEIDRISLDIAELVDLNKNIDSLKLNVSNIVEDKRVRKSKQTANLVASLEIIVSKKINSNKIKKIYSTFAIIIKSTRLHLDNLLSSSKLWRDMLRHSHAEDFQKVVEFEYQTLIKMSIFNVVLKALDQKSLSLIWVFIYKFDLARFLIRSKTRCGGAKVTALENS
jgi:hypothetical protein